MAIEPARLDDSARNALTFGMSGAQPEERQGEFRKSVPGFRVTWDPLGVGPILWIGNENGSELSVVGGTLWDSAWFREHGEGWRNSGYPLVQEHLKQRQSGAAGGPIAARSLADWVRLAATKQKVNILFDHTYPRGGQGAGGPWLGNTPEQTLSALVLSGGLTWKPHKAFHLLRDKTATIHPRRHLLPWSKIRTLRGTAERNDGYLSLVDLRGLGDLNWEQLAGLAEEFPDTSPDRLALWMPILEFYSHLDAGPAKRIITEAGVPLRETGLVARAALGDGPDPQGIRNLKLLQEHFREVIVSLRQETYRDKARTRVPHRPAMEQERRRLVWEAWTPPDGTRYRREFRLSPREPLLPE